jgi:hypothetical protein
MQRIQFACYLLLASAFMLGGILLVQAERKLTPKAYGEMVVNRDNLTVMTTRTSPNEEALFVLDNLNEKLLIYEAQLRRKRINFVQMLDLKAIQPNGGSGDRRGNRR